ncbi:MAG: adenylate/guanylate cyclase domain-containing protein, partial [Pseudomonadota bacterium]
MNISKSNGVFDYWDKEAFLIGVQNAAELNLPETWNGIILRHFAQMRSKIVKEWLSSNENQNIQKTLLGSDQASKETLQALSYFLQGKSEDYSETPLAEAFPWSSLKTIIPKKTKVDLFTKMKQSVNDYCLRYLTEKDELKPAFLEAWPKIKKEYEKFSELNFEQATDYIMATTLSNPVHHVDRWLFNIPEIQEVTEHSGTFNATQDKDGSVRRAKLFVRNGNLIIPSLAFKTYLVINDFYPTANLIPNPYENPPESNIVTNVKIKNAEDKHVLTIPTDHRGQLPINYAGPQKMFSYLSAGEILDGGDTLTIQQRVQNQKGEWVEEDIQVDKKDYLKNKSFIFGATATGIYDLRVTPFEENYPGVETHANLLDNLIRQDYLKTNPQEEFLMPFAIFLLGLLFSFVVAKLGAISGLIIALSSLVAIYMVDAFFIFPKGTVITILFPIFTILFLYTLLTFFKYFTEERKKKELKGTFQKYVSPEIVNEILKDPTKLELGGMKQEMTVFFSDIRGFTTISEKLDPKALSDLLNHYLTPMTDIIFKNSGTLDKYMGDAIMAFFGAPVPSEKHAAQACRAALIQIDKLFELQKIYQEQGLPMIDIGIGINTGDMSVGNMGSETVRNYTVMGDSVNLGSRLEGINKQYGTRIIIS